MGDTPFEPLFLPFNIIHLTWQKHFRCLQNAILFINDFYYYRFLSWRIPHLLDSGAIQRARANKWIENAGVFNLHAAIEVHPSSVGNRAFLMPFSVKLVFFETWGFFFCYKMQQNMGKMPHF